MNSVTCSIPTTCSAKEWRGDVQSAPQPREAAARRISDPGARAGGVGPFRARWHIWPSHGQDELTLAISEARLDYGAGGHGTQTKQTPRGQNQRCHRRAVLSTSSKCSAQKLKLPHSFFTAI